MRREDDGVIRWFRRDGTRYLAGPSPGVETYEAVRSLTA
jgi:hypothetical protein